MYDYESQELGERVLPEGGHRCATDVCELLPCNAPWDRHGELFRIYAWLYGNRSTGSFDSRNIRMRMAPSIIARSELELLSLSSPRFSVRVYLGDNGFINARRMKAVERSMRYADMTGELENEIVQTIRSSSWVADSMLRLPDDLADYRALTAALQREYDENYGSELVPYVKHIGLGGGQCSQAACFMALCIVPTTPVLGLSEITAAIAAESEYGFVGIGDATPATIRRFFNSAATRGTAAEMQFLQIGVDTQLSSNAEDSLTAVLSGYLQSGSPILYFASQSRMYNDATRDVARPKSIIDPVLLDKNERLYADATETEKPKEPADYLTNDRSHVPFTKLHEDLVRTKRNDEVIDSHCALIVGYQPDDCKIPEAGAPRIGKFLLNDPGSMPFLVVSTDQLIDVRPYRERTDDRVDGADRPLGDNDLVPVTFIPVVGQGVRAHLLPTEAFARRRGFAQPRFSGLVELSCLTLAAHGDYEFLVKYRPKDLLGRSSWWLACLGDDGSLQGQFESECPFPAELAEALVDNKAWLLEEYDLQATANSKLLTERKTPGNFRWVWLQMVAAKTLSTLSTYTGDPPESTLWVWDATEPVEGDYDVLKSDEFLVCSLALRKTGWEKLWSPSR